MNDAFQQGLFFFNRKQFDRALSEFAISLSADPTNAHTWSLLALCEMTRSKFSQARANAEEAIRFNPASAYGYFALAQVLYHDIQFVSMRSGDPSAYIQVSDVRMQRFKVADQAIKEAIRLEPQSVQYFAFQATIAFARGRIHEAFAAAEAGLAIRPDDAECQRLRSVFFNVRGDLKSSSAAALKALENEPESALSHAVAGWAALQTGNHRNAREHFEESLRLNPMNRSARIGLVETIRSRFILYRPFAFVRSQGGALVRRHLWRFVLGAIAVTALIFLFLRRTSTVEDAIAETAELTIGDGLLLGLLFVLANVVTGYTLLYDMQVVELMPPYWCHGQRLIAAALTFIIAFTAYMWCLTFASQKIDCQLVAEIGIALVVTVYLLPAIYRITRKRMRRRALRHITDARSA